jgi:hypothetical protein
LHIVLEVNVVGAHPTRQELLVSPESNPTAHLMIHFVDYIAFLAFAVEETLSSVGTIVLVVEETL